MKRLNDITLHCEFSVFKFFRDMRNTLDLTWAKMGGELYTRK